jgi:hypothetical protein
MKTATALRTWQRLAAAAFGIIALSGMLAAEITSERASGGDPDPEAQELGELALVNGDGTKRMWATTRVTLAISVIMSWVVPAGDVLLPWSEEIGAFSILVGKMLWRDVCCRWALPAAV